jgi:hypothetical protein
VDVVVGLADQAALVEIDGKGQCLRQPANGATGFASPHCAQREAQAVGDELAGHSAFAAFQGWNTLSVRIARFVELAFEVEKPDEFDRQIVALEDEISGAPAATRAGPCPRRTGRA